MNLRAHDLVRAHDFGIGIAVAWARYYGEDVVELKDGERGRAIDLLVWSQDQGEWDLLTVDRGPWLGLVRYDAQLHQRRR